MLLFSPPSLFIATQTDSAAAAVAAGGKGGEAELGGGGGGGGGGRGAKTFQAKVGPGEGSRAKCDFRRYIGFPTICKAVLVLES